MSESIQPDDKHRINITVSEEALQVLQRYSTSRKRGELVSQLLIDYARTISVTEIVVRLEKRIEVLEDEIEALRQSEDD